MSADPTEPAATGCNFCGHEWDEVNASRCPECGHSDLRTVHQSTDLITLVQALRATPAVMAEEAAARIEVLEAENAQLRATLAKIGRETARCRGEQSYRDAVQFTAKTVREAMADGR